MCVYVSVFVQSDGEGREGGQASRLVLHPFPLTAAAATDRALCPQQLYAALDLTGVASASGSVVPGARADETIYAAIDSEATNRVKMVR